MLRAIKTKLIRTRADKVGAIVVVVLIVVLFGLTLAGVRLGLLGLLYLACLWAGLSFAYLLLTRYRPGGGYKKLGAASLVILTLAGWRACGIVGSSAGIQWLAETSDIRTLPGLSAFGFAFGIMTVAFSWLFRIGAWKEN